MGDTIVDAAIDGDFGKLSLVSHTDAKTPFSPAREVVEDVASEDSADESSPKPTPIEYSKTFRLEQIDLFKSLVLEKAAEIDENQEQKKQNRAANIDNGLTIEQLMEEQGKAALNDPREYQLELYERAKKENTIAVLETGSGKTLIAVLLMRYILDQEIEDRSNALPPRTTFFLVPSNALVYQQTSVLKCNIDHGIAARCGDMNISNPLERTSWEKRLSQNMVVVCTPEILHQCLRHSIVTMAAINLLVFDEAHHAKKGAPYAKIMEDFYKSQPVPEGLRKPRVFGMTASPFGANEDPIRASEGLENLLDCKIATYPLSEEYRNKAKDMVLYFQTLRGEFKTPLFQKLDGEIGNIEAFKHLFETAKYLSSHLGRWAAEKFWAYALREEEKRKAQSKIEKAHGRHNKRKLDMIDAEISQLQSAYKLVQNYDFGKPRIDLDSISSKVFELHRFLCEHYNDDLQNRCIVFVERKATARMLKEIFHEIGATYLKPDILTGYAAKSGDANISFRQQVLTMSQFRKGEINCLFATSVAEEGLDVPECNLVIRFDPYDTVIQYIQSKGRARHKNSKFVDMIEQGNMRTLTKRNDARYGERRLRQWIENLDPERKLSGNDEYENTQIGRVFTHPETNAKLTYWSALGVLSLFASTLPVEDKLSIKEPAYIMSIDSRGYYCEVIMPDHSPIRSAFGQRYPRKGLAKRSAAFEMCFLLLKSEFLDNRLLSKFEKMRPIGANDHLAVSEKKTGKYVMQLKPSLWADGRGSIPDTVHLTIIDMPDGLERPHQPIGLLTRHPLPQFPSFPLFLDSEKITNVQTIPRPGFKVTENEIGVFTAHTLRLWYHVNAKVFEKNAANMSYWVVPVLSQWDMEIDSRNCIDWNAMETAVVGEYQRWTPDMPPEFLENKFIVDPWAGNRRFFSIGVDQSLKPLDNIPENTAKFDRPGANKRKSILQYSVSLFGQTFDEQWPKWNKEQPVIECTQVMHRQNLLAPPTSKEQNHRIRATRAFLCPEPLVISALPVKVVTMFLVFPPIIHRIEDYLIAIEATKIVGVDVGPALALEAMTKDSDNNDDHATDDRSNFRPGMGNNYERLEFMGDCFLKAVTSISLFVVKPHDDEFGLHVARMNMICNRNLMNKALELNLTPYVRSMAFSRRLWYPEALKLLEGKGAGKTGGTEVQKHSLGDKSIADVCEALIGAAFIQHNNKHLWLPQAWTNAIKAVTKLVNDANHVMQMWDDYSSAYTPPLWQTANATAPQRELAKKIYKEQNYNFEYPRLLCSAFSHPSLPFAWEKVQCYQRLEFLGDALLDLVCVTHLFYNYTDKNPQWLTEHKMAMVSNKFLGALCVKIGFHRRMRHNQPLLGAQIKAYVDEIEFAEEGARQRGECDYWTHVKDPPKCLSDIVEAYIGALFIDSGFCYAEVQRFFDKNIKPFFMDMAAYGTFTRNHPTTHLYHTLSQIYGCQAYQLLCESVDPPIIGSKPKVMAGLMVHRELVTSVFGDSGRYAKERASKKASHELQGMTVKEFKAKFGCDCKAAEECESADVKMENGVTV